MPFFLLFFVGGGGGGVVFFLPFVFVTVYLIFAFAARWPLVR